jgi:hypothetical protein
MIARRALRLVLTVALVAAVSSASAWAQRGAAARAALEPLSFDVLSSFPFRPPPHDPKTPDGDSELGMEQVPEAVRQLDGRRVAITGFMLPIRVKEGHVTEFLLLRDQSLCCFGTIPSMNDWIVVKAAGRGVRPLMDVPITIGGTLQVRGRFENSYLIGIYHMSDAEHLSTGFAPNPPVPESLR